MPARLMIKKEAAAFILVGVTAVVVDYVGYETMSIRFGWDAAGAKVLGFFAGTFFSYAANRFWTFSHNESRSGSLWRFACLYSITLAVNVAVNSLFLILLAQLDESVFFAFLVATGCSAGLNFVGLKFFVFRNDKGA
jgi:putative flippase GtrA